MKIVYRNVKNVKTILSVIFVLKIECYQIVNVQKDILKFKVNKNVNNVLLHVLVVLKRIDVPNVREIDRD